MPMQLSSGFLRQLLIASGILLVAAGTCAQPVYRCEVAGKITYSHEPCLNAKIVDTTPTQGMDKSSGQSRKENDVRANERNKAMADALKPLFNESPDEREQRHRRFKLAPDVRNECAKLDSRLVEEQAAARGASGAAAVREADAALLSSRLRFRELRC